jgi:curli biogenesis system outer membrane secretion channel CsgG
MFARATSILIAAVGFLGLPNWSLAKEPEVSRCDTPLGYVAVVELDAYALEILWRYRLRSPGPLLRMVIQQSGCFTVVERGVGVEAVLQERQLAARGQLRSGSAMGEGQLVAADYILTPSVIFSNDNAGGVRAGLGDFVGSRWASLTPGVKFKEAQTGLTLVDARTGIQVGAAETTTRKADLSLSAWMFGRGGYSSFEGYGNTAEGKLIASSLVTNFNALVSTVRHRLPTRQSNIQPTASTAPADFSIGEVVVPKISGLVLRAMPSDQAASLAELGQEAELVVIGAVTGEYLPVQSGTLRGWLPILLLRRP